MDEKRQDDQLESIDSSSEPIQDIALTCREQWTIGTGGERELRRSVLAARHDDDEFSFAFNFASDLVASQ